MNENLPPPLSDFAEPAVINAPRGPRKFKKPSIFGALAVPVGIVIVVGLMVLFGTLPSAEERGGKAAALSAAEKALRSELAGVQKIDVVLEKQLPLGVYRVRAVVERLNVFGGPVREEWIVAVRDRKAYEIANVNAALKGACDGSIA